MTFLLEQAQKKIDGLGNSGCKLEILPGNPMCIKKTALSDAYMGRLKNQRIKQQKFLYPMKSIRVPMIFSFDYCSFTMEHLPMLDAIEFFERAEFETIQTRINILFDFIRWEIGNSALAEVSAQLFLDKLSTIKAQVSIGIWKDYYFKYEEIFKTNLPEKMLILLGSCHGDLTFSNIMFSMRENQIGLIDFLDNFLDSPLTDIAKLLQDARFHWSSYKFPFPHDRGKIHIINSYVQTWVEKEFIEEISSLQFWVIQMMNYFRIIPYVHSPKDHEYVSSILAQISTLKGENR